MLVPASELESSVVFAVSGAEQELRTNVAESAAASAARRCVIRDRAVREEGFVMVGRFLPGVVELGTMRQSLVVVGVDRYFRVLR